MNIIVLSERDPDPRGGRYVLVESDDEGRYHGTGFGHRDGSDTIYISKAEDDEDLSTSISAAKNWARGNGVSVVYVRDAATRLE